MENTNPIATDIYERLEMNKEGAGGNVYSDIQDILIEGNFQDFEDYFGDTDPFEFL